MSTVQTDVNEKMRAILVDWLIEVHNKFKLLPETLFLTVNLIDRYLEKCDVVRTKLQLVGVTAMLIACKYEEIYAPEVRDFVYITDKAYTKEEILDQEHLMLAVPRDCALPNESDLFELRLRELLLDSLQGAHIYSVEQDTHVFGTRPQVGLGIPGVSGESVRP